MMFSTRSFIETDLSDRKDVDIIMSLNRLPVELVHQIFTYLSITEIFYAFSNLTDYLDATLISYNRYALNFRSVLKSHFDVTCRFIRPDRVISLTLSDDDETPDQSELFFSRFNIEQFINLRSFDISLMNNDTCKKLFHLNQLKYLSSLELPRLFQPSCEGFDITVKKILPQLNRLMAYSTQYLLDNSLPNLHHLILKYCNYGQLSTLFKHMPNLHSLDIILLIDPRSYWPQNVPVLTYLRKLVFTSYGEKLEMKGIRTFLSKMPNLKHFELDTEGSIDLLDGQQWESIVSHLITFDFRIRVLDRPQTFSEENIFQSFRSLFWLEYKRWFVAYDMQHFFTVPRFISNIVKYPFTNWPPLCTSSDFCFDQYIKTLRISLLNPVPHRFPNITSLRFDINEISTDIGSNAFISLVEHMQFLHSISFQNLSILNNLPMNVVFEKIRSLDVRENVQVIKRLYTVFPRLERLNIKLTSDNDLLLLIDRLRYLSIAKFELNHSSLVTHNWLMKNSQCLKSNNNFTLKIIKNTIYLWINHDQQVSTSYSPLTCTLQ